MITVATVLARLPGLDADRLQYWITQEWVRPVRRGGEVLFGEIDVARLHLILDLQELEVGEDAVPVVLSLLDQLHESRRHMRRLLDALDAGAAEEVARRLRTTRPDGSLKRE
jgi:chaperone modulatory protein CbpM